VCAEPSGVEAGHFADGEAIAGIVFLACTDVAALSG
jgi:hypothetical protein